MNETSAFPVNGSRPSVGQRKALVWDAPVRLFHWLMVLCFVGAYVTAESERWRLLHVTLGYTLGGLVAFRLVWGFVGSRYARFSEFVRGPRAVAKYVSSLMRGQPQHYVGHNPAGAIAIVLLLALSILITLSGWALYNDLSGEWLEEVHETISNLMLAVVAIHILGVVSSSWLHRENLIASMISGLKAVGPSDAIRSAWRSIAIVMLVAVLTFWWVQWQGAPTSDQPTQKPAQSERRDD